MDKFDPTKFGTINTTNIITSAKGLQQSLRQSEALMREIERSAEEKRRKKEEYEKQLLEATLQIRDNTSSLPEIVTLLRQSNLNQEEMRFVLEDIAALIMAKDKKDAESILRRALAKVNDAAHSVESIGILTQALMLFYNTVVPLLDKIPQ